VPSPTTLRVITSGVKKYVLDLIPNHGCVMGFSLYKLTNTYKGYCLEVQRQSDNTTLNVGFVNDYVDKLAIETFCTGTTGKVKTWYNQFVTNNATQSNSSLMPTICTNGVFETNGIKFVASESTYLEVEAYSLIDITSPPLSLYHNSLTAVQNSGTAYLFSKAYTLTGVQYGIVHSKTTVFYHSLRLGDNIDILKTQILESVHKILCTWENKSENGVTVNIDSVEALSVRSTDLTTRQKFVIGCRADGASSYLGFYNGYLKTILIFNTNQKNNYNKISGGC